MTVAKVDQAEATHSYLRTVVLSLTPSDSKCRLYCKGRACRYCSVFEGPSAIPGLYSTWITDQILAMARPQPAHFENDRIVHLLKENGISAVFNLEEVGEHALCGSGNLEGGFSYDPERFMRNNIFYYNFPLPDFEACTPARLVDIVTVVAHELTKGKVAVHCHAGHGRTGMVIAACLMLVRGLSPREAVELVRGKRSGSVQSPEQVRALHSLHILLFNNASVLPASPFRSVAGYVEYTSRVLPKNEIRRYGMVPKPLFVGFIAILRKFFTSVILKPQSVSENPWLFQLKCTSPKGLLVNEEALYLMRTGITARGQAYYFERAGKGMNLLNMERILEDEKDIVALLALLDYFMRTAFFQLTTSEELVRFLETTSQGKHGVEKDWSCSVCFMLCAICCLPPVLHVRLASLLVEWFARGDTKAAGSVLGWISRTRSPK
ncbi:hypothetical protein Q1695_006748 [Nippostrongylus brasiliensis]|nr:hypothetical protein Q1695_006748 [Nippostrongylus brasiliensis]